ncbi:LysE family transporter [Acerihabitans sp. TG2]|uniref:LysE family translocator n=1 Tax=Acerihabitans sp. TG2 TaxID=3096008 RepID=UPI002B222649|nr:LysE family transporter [Acerihabitans sp. TG2]MEA9391213.1 LysE family transporter [Acerihabitans sp. TG2]
MEIFLFALSVMYSPGPVNIMGLGAGLTGQFRQTVGFFLGVGVSLFCLFVLFGYLGESFIAAAYLPYISVAGIVYILYLGIKIINSRVEIKDKVTAIPVKRLTFWNGFLIQSMNPKCLLVVLPITTVMFPAAHVTGNTVFLLSLLLGAGGAGAPGCYALLGTLIGRSVAHAGYFKRVNQLMGGVLMMVAAIMLYELLRS